MTATKVARRREFGARVLDWWTQYCHPLDGDPAVRARLRRCRSATDALGVPAAIDLARRTGAVAAGREAVALDLARVLAHVTANTGEPPMRAAGWKRFPGDRKESDAGDERPRLSEVRFRRLVRAERGDELTDAVIRLMAMLDGGVSVPRLAEDFWWWNDQIRQRWAFDYYAAGVAAPNDVDDPDSPDPATPAETTA